MDSTEWIISCCCNVSSSFRWLIKGLLASVPPCLVSRLNPWNADHSSIQFKMRMSFVIILLAPGEGRVGETWGLKIKLPIGCWKVFLFRKLCSRLFLPLDNMSHLHRPEERKDLPEKRSHHSVGCKFFNEGIDLQSSLSGTSIRHGCPALEGSENTALP